VRVAEPFHFDGFGLPTYTQVPDELFDQLLPFLKEAEIKALLYIIRRTFGFKKQADAISFNQFLKGITTADGRQLDHGCGIKSPTNLSNALKSLEGKGIITAHKLVDVKGRLQTTTYALRFREGVLPKQEYRTTESGVGVLPQQEQQQTVSQETGGTTNSLDDSTDSTGPGPPGVLVKEPMDMSPGGPSRPMTLEERLAWQERMEAQERRLRPRPPP
jgi:hypothetical protein